MSPIRMIFRRFLPLVLAVCFCVAPASLAGAAPETAPDPAAAPAVALPVPTPVAIRVDTPPAKPTEVRKENFRLVHDQVAPLTMFLDGTGLLDIKSIQEHLAAFNPLDSLRLWRSGALWLKLSMTDVKEASSRALWLDLGLQIPKDTRVWTSLDGRDWKPVSAAAAGMYSLREAGGAGQVLVRLNGLPGLWFKPVLRSPENFDVSPERLVRLPLVAVLAVLSLLCLLLSITERGEGRIWTAILAASAAVQVAWGVSVAPSAHMSVDTLPGILAAGVALVMLPHEGRALMNTHRTSPFTDILFLLLTLPGACAAVVPLIPGLGWTARLLPLWPAVGLVCLFPALILLVRGVQGSGPFVLTCLSMGAGVAVSLYGLGRGADVALWGLALPGGVVLGLLFLAASAPHREEAEETFLKRNLLDLDVSLPEVESRKGVSSDIEPVLRNLAEELLDESCRLDQALNRLESGPETVEVMRHADGMVAVSRRLVERIRRGKPSGVIPESSEQNFDLREVIQKVFASVSAEADRKELGLAWYVAPYLGQFYRGDSRRLTSLLTMLLADSVSAAERGAVRLQVRRSLMSTHPGHLQFTISDNGEGRPPRERSSLLLARAWELSADCGGDFFVGFTSQGLELTFGMEFTALEVDGMTVHEAPPRENSGEAPVPDGKLIILAAADGLCRQICAHYLEDMGYRVWEACDGAESFTLYTCSPSALMIFDGSLGEEDMAQTVASIRIFEGEHALPAVPFLLLARSEDQAERMGKAGCEETLFQPVVRRDLRALAQWLIAADGSPRPVLSAQRVTLAAVLAGAQSGNVRLQRKKGLRPERSGRKAEEEERIVSSSEPSTAQIAGQSVPEENAGLQERVEPFLSMEGEPAEKKKSWFSSLFARGEGGAPLEVRTDDSSPACPEDRTENDASFVELRQENMISEGDVMELSSEHVLSEESGIHELTAADLVSSPCSRQDEDEPSDGSERCGEGLGDAKRALDLSLSGTQEGVTSASGNPSLDTLLGPVLDTLDAALQTGDAAAIRMSVRKLSSVADSYGLHTLSDMVHCFCVAWESGVISDASQIIQEMRGEVARQGR